jgi:Protein of unknown function (DUF3995)
LNSWVTLFVCAAFVLIALWHFRMAFSPSSGESAAVPSVDGKPLFVPSRKSTIAVGVVLLVFAVLVAATGGLLPTGLPPMWLSVCCGLLALGLLARAIGDFRYVGLFKKVRGTPFANMDTRIYSPLCLLLAIGVAVVAIPA